MKIILNTSLFSDFRVDHTPFFSTTPFHSEEKTFFEEQIIYGVLCIVVYILSKMEYLNKLQCIKTRYWFQKISTHLQV